MTGGKPVRLTFPSYDTGAADIMHAGKIAGIVLDEGGRWRAYLYGTLRDRRVREGGEEEVAGRTLGEVRETLRERVEVEGPWWRD